MNVAMNYTNLSTQIGNLSVEIVDNGDNQNGCMLYNFIINTLIIGLLCVFGLIGNLVAYTVFWKDNIKTSTTFLFQGLSLIDTVLLVMVFPLYVLDPIVNYGGVLHGFKEVI